MQFGAGESLTVMVPAPLAVVDPEYSSASAWDWDAEAAEVFELVDVAVDDADSLLFAGRAQRFPDVDFVAYVPPGQRAVEAHYRVSVRGEIAYLDGKQAEWVDPFTGQAWGSVLRLKRVGHG